MTIRVIVQTCDGGMACHVGGPVQTTYDTFDIEDERLEAFLRQTIPGTVNRQVVGVSLPSEAGKP